MSPVSIRICVTNLVSFPTVVSKKEGGGTQTHKQTHTHQGCGQVPVLVLVLVLVLKYNFIST